MCRVAYATNRNYRNRDCNSSLIVDPFCIVSGLLYSLVILYIFPMPLIVVAQSTVSIYGNSISNSNSNPQPCPENPIVLAARADLQYIHSPYTYDRKYPPNCNCKFLLVAQSPKHRIDVTVVDSELEEPIFGQCEDFCAIYDGNSTVELARWCGTGAPLAISAQSDTILLHFWSDAIVEKRGFNISFRDYEIGDCPPDWLADRSRLFCYRLHSPSPHAADGFVWTDAQRECARQRANLLTFENLNEYEFVYESFFTSHSAPWTGYNDVEAEGTFKSVLSEEAVWPDKLSTTLSNSDEKDCLYLNWQGRESVAYAAGDCRERRAFICKKRRDSSTTPVLLATGFIRQGLYRRDAFAWALTILCLLFALLLLCALMCIAAWRYREWRKRRVVVGSQRMASGASSAASVRSQAPGEGVQRLSPVHTLTVPHLREAQQTVAKAEQQHQQRQQQNEMRETDDRMHTNLEKGLRRYDTTQSEHDEKRIRQGRNAQAERFESFSDGEYDNATAEYDMHAHDNAAHSPRIRTTPNQPLPAGWATNGANTVGRHSPNREHFNDVTAGGRRSVKRTSSGNDAARNEYGNVDGNRHADSMDVLNDVIDVNDVTSSSSMTLAGGIGYPVISQNGNDVELKRYKLAHQQQIDRSDIRHKVTSNTTRMAVSNDATVTDSISRLRVKRKSFERPYISTLEGVSAISLDEFWQNANETN